VEIFSCIAIVSIFLTAIISLIAGIIQTIKENKQLDREENTGNRKKQFCKRWTPGKLIIIEQLLSCQFYWLPVKETRL
jgi:hypothetical protein